MDLRALHRHGEAIDQEEIVVGGERRHVEILGEGQRDQDRDRRRSPGCGPPATGAATTARRRGAPPDARGTRRPPATGSRCRSPPPARTRRHSPGRWGSPPAPPAAARSPGRHCRRPGTATGRSRSGRPRPAGPRARPRDGTPSCRRRSAPPPAARVVKPPAMASTSMPRRSRPSRTAARTACGCRSV